MKSLIDYTQALQTELFNSTGAFFAFSNSQLEESKKAGVDYVSMGSGLIVPKANAQKLHDGLESIHANGIKQDIKENGKKAIIHRELANYEAQITNSIDDTVQALVDYGFTESDIKAEYKDYFQMCIDNDYF